MQLLPAQNFLLESFCFTEYLQFAHGNWINCFIWLETHFKSLGDCFGFCPGVNSPIILCHMAAGVQLLVSQTAWIPSPDIHSCSPTMWPRTQVSHRVVSMGRRMASSCYILHKATQDLIVLIPKWTVSQCADFFLTWTDVTSSDYGTLGVWYQLWL